MIDLTNAPDDATHYAIIDLRPVWYKFGKIMAFANTRGEWLEDESSTEWLIDNLTRIDWPVELIDGQAYQFNIEQGVMERGIYRELTGSFYNVDGDIESDMCTNIIKLVPEVK